MTTASFIGKWTFTQSTAAVQAAASGGALWVGSPPTDGSDRFNAYGADSAFVLQASNGQYVVAAGSGYAATAPTASSANRFALADDGAGGFHVVDLGTDPTHPGTHLWNHDGGTLARAAASNPPATTQFSQAVVTPGLASIMANGLRSPQPDLSWVNLAGVDFTRATALLDFTQAKLDNADFNGAKLPRGTAFDGSTAAGANFANATLPGCSFGDVDFRGGAAPASFAGAALTGVDFDHTDLTGADLSGAVMTDTSNLANAVFEGADLTDADLRNTANIVGTSFAAANLTGVDFSGSSVTGTMDISGANLSGATLSNPATSVTIFGNNLVISSTTNFRGAKLRHLDLTGFDLRNINFAGADLTGCKLDRARLDDANLGFATLAGATLTGVSLHGANLSSADLQGVDLSAAQLGAVGQLFRVGSDQTDYQPFLTGLNDGDVQAVIGVFKANQVPLSGTVTVRESAFSSTTWQVQTATTTYSVVQETVGTATSLVVYQPTSPAVLANAFMVDVNLKGANLYGVRASGAQLYATAGAHVNLNTAKLDGLQVNNANLGNIDLSQANLAGVNFDYAILTGADFTGATISTDAQGGQPSFNGANLQGASFSSAQLHDVIMSNAAVAVPSPTDATAAAGVWLFTIDAQQASLVIPQLQAASAPAGGGPQPGFTIPTEVLPQMQATGPVPQGVAASFRKADITLAKSAILVIVTTDVYWQLANGSTSWVIFPSVNDDYQPALAVAPGTAYTLDADFYLPLSLQSALGNGPVSADVVGAFGDAGHPVACSAIVTIAQYPSVWQVISGGDTYTAWLMFDSSVLGVDTEIQVRAGIPNVLSVFGGFSIPLSIRATVDRLPNGGWRIGNDAVNPFNPARGYIEFQAFQRADGGLNVYGSLIRIVRLSAPGVEEYFNVPCDVTVLAPAALAGAGNTVCPNGATVAANQSGQLPFEQWLWARYLPSPPLCVPDPQGKFNCPS